MNGDTNTLRAIQGLIGVTQDGVFGPASRAALEALIQSSTKPAEVWTATHKGLASSFADPADVRAFKRCKEEGGSDAHCFGLGDNGVGCWEDDCSEGSGPSCALPPDDMIEKFGSVAAAKHAQVKVTMGSRTVLCVLKDRMPWKRHITNKAIIDLNPDAVAALGHKPPIMEPASWEWA
jgi:hypothetical protein